MSMIQFRGAGVLRFLPGVCACLLLSAGTSTASDCTRTSVGLVPLPELGAAYYKGRQGGLYPEGGNARPPAHEAAGLDLARKVRPLNAQGDPDDNGRIVLVSIGMSNTTQEFSTFKPLADSDPAKNPKLVIVDGAQGGMAANRIYDMNLSSAQQFWSTVDTRLQAAGVTPSQVQVAWIKQADISPTQPFPDDALQLKDELAKIARIMKQRYPNIRITYCSSRIYAGYATTTLNPEPYAYQGGFAVKWLIEDQINGAADLNYDPARGERRAPWLSWGPYLWADGLTPRSDGLTYACSDLADDGTHPAAGGARSKVARLLLDFFKSDSTARLFFLASQSAAVTLQYPILSVGVSGTSGSEYTGLAVVNPGDVDTTLRFTLLDQDGAAVAGPEITNPVEVGLKAGGQLATLDVSLFGRGTAARSGPAWLKSESSSPSVLGCFLAFDGSLAVLDGAEALTGGLTSFVFPEVETEGFTEMRIANPGSESTAVSFQLVKSDGTPRSVVANRTVKPGGVLATALAELFPGVGADAADYVRVRSGSGVAPVQWFGKRGKYLSALRGQDASGGATVLYSPQYASGDRWFTSFSIVNLEAKAGTLKLELLDDDGRLIAARSSLSLEPYGKLSIREGDFFGPPGNAILQGHVRITGTVKIAGSVLFGDPGRDQFAAALPLTSAFQYGIVFCQAASDSTWFTGLALMNPGDVAASARIDLFDSNGNIVAAKPELILGSGRKSQEIKQYFPELAGRQLSSGYIRVSSDQPLAGYALFGTHSLTSLSAIPAQAVP